MKTIKYIASLFFLSIALVSCVKGDFDVPEVTLPRSELKANMTIADFKAMHDVDFVEIADSIILSGVIVGNDISGNIYKKIIVEDSTGGLDIEIDATNLYSDFPIGRTVMINCKGLYAGKYRGQPQIGDVSQDNYGSTVVGRMTLDKAKKHLEAHGALKNPTPTSLTIAKAQSDLRYINCLIKLTNVQFPDAESDPRPTFSLEESTSNRNIFDGSEIMFMRNSNYAKFAGYYLPKGSGDVVGVLGIFNGEYQLFLRSIDDLSGFKIEKPE